MTDTTTPTTPARRRSELPEGECRSCDEDRGRMHPAHDASPRCQSGGRSHCSCDTCF